MTPAAGFIQPWGAFVLGLLAALLCYTCCEARKVLGFDDALDVWGVHGMGGFIGTVLLGALAYGSECFPEGREYAARSWACCEALNSHDQWLRPACLDPCGVGPEERPSAADDHWLPPAGLAPCRVGPVGRPSATHEHSSEIYVLVAVLIR